MEKFIYKGRVRYSECDPMKNAHNAFYYTYFEEARTELAREAGFTYAKIEELGLQFPVSESGAKFLKQIMYDEEFIIETYFEYIKNFSFKIIYEVKNLNNEICCSGFTLLGSVSNDRDFKEIPLEFKESMKKHSMFTQGIDKKRK